MALETGALILADYTARVKDTGQIFETTRREDAEKAGIADPTRNYEPKLIAIGEPSWSLVLKAVDEALQKADPGQTIDVELPPEKAFGPRDPTKLSRIPIRRFGEKASDLSVGAEVEIDNRVGIVRQLESGRALVDFNHRLAGKTLVYNIFVKEKLEDRNAKIEALIKRRLPVDKEKIKFESEGDSGLRIYIPNEIFLWEGLQITKRGISNDLFKFIKPLEKVTFVETYENPSKKAEEQAPAQAAQKEEEKILEEEEKKPTAGKPPEPSEGERKKEAEKKEEEEEEEEARKTSEKQPKPQKGKSKSSKKGGGKAASSKKARHS